MALNSVWAAEKNKKKPFGALRESISQETLEAALALRGPALCRNRKLPPDITLWLTIGMALFRGQSLCATARDMNLWVDGVPAASSLCEARKRLGSKPLIYLATEIARKWSEEVDQPRWKNLSVFAVDGTILDLADTAEIHEHFGRPGSARDTVAGYPQARCVAQMNVLSRYVTDTETTPLATHERTSSLAIAKRTANDSLTILDRGFQGFRSFCAFSDQKQNRHFLARVKSTFRCQFIRSLEGSTYIGKLKPTAKADRDDSTLPEDLTVRVIECQVEGSKEPMTLVTSLLDETAYPALDIAQMYHSRWEIELGFKEVKMVLCEDKEALRSRSVDGVYQEIGAIFTAYNLIRREMYQAARAVRLMPSRISFKLSLQLTQKFFLSFSHHATSLSKIPRELAKIRDALAECRLPVRRTTRSYPRWVKKKMSNFLKKPPLPHAGPKKA